MSIIRYQYDNMFDKSTVVRYSSQLAGLPASNIQKELLSKLWRTEDNFIIKTGYNDTFSFIDTSTDSMHTFVVASGTYTGNGLASVVQAGINANGVFDSSTVIYDSTVHRFTIAEDTATGLALHFDVNPNESLATIMGWDKDTRYSGLASYISPHPTKGNQHYLELSSSDVVLSGSCLIVDAHNFSSGTVMKFRAASTSTYFDGIGGRKRGDGIFQATTNLADPDFTNWTNVNSEDELIDMYADGKQFTKVTNVGANTGNVHEDYTDTWTTLTPSFSVIIKKGNSVGNTTRFIVYNPTRSRNAFDLILDWDNYSNAPGTVNTGTLHNYDWIDSKTIELHCICESLDALTDDLRILCFGSNNSTDGEFTYWAAPQAEDLSYPTPFVDGTRAAFSPDFALNMPEMFIFKIKCKPWFVYDTTILNLFLTWFINATHYFKIRWAPGVDKIYLGWIDGFAEQGMYSEQFDNGTTFDDINSELIICGAVRFDQQTGQRFFVIVDGVKQTEDTDFTGAPNAKVSTFLTASIGHDSKINHADSLFESVEIWRWDGTDLGTIADEDDFDTAVEAYGKLLDKNYKNTGWMRQIGTSTTFGMYEREITVDNERQYTELTSTVQAMALQVSWWDGDNVHSDLGRLWFGPIFQPLYQQTNTISYSNKRLGFRSRQMRTDAGGTMFDKFDPLDEYQIPIHPLDAYYNPATKTGFENMIEEIRNDKSFYLSLDHNRQTSTVYVFQVSKAIDFARIKNTPTFGIKNLIFREQK